MTTQTTTPHTGISYEEFNKKLASLRTAEDVVHFARDLLAPTLQTILEAEMEEHLGYKKHEVRGRNTGNSRNGYSKKTMRTSFGPATIEIPRDRNADFEPQIIPKHTTIQNDMEKKIIAMYARGMTTRDIHTLLKETYGIDVSASMVSSVTDAIIPQIQEWQSRPLSPLYPIVYLDGVHFKVRKDGRVVTTCAYIVLGVNESGHKEILGIWVGEAESATFWMSILSELKSRGVDDILIACTDGLSGFAEAISAIFPKTRIQQCIVHQVRNTLKYIPHKDREKVAKALKAIYTAVSLEAGREALGVVQKEFPQYAVALKGWETKWDVLSSFFEYPEEIRRIIYTTNTIEGLNRQFRKVTKTTTIFPHDQALTKLLYLAAGNISKSWTVPIRNWGVIVQQFAILFPERSAALITN